MKIKGWEKLSGITYKGLTIVNPIHNANETTYSTEIINFNKPDKPFWKLKVLTNNHKFRMGSTDFFVTITGENKMSTQCIVSKDMMLKLSDFRKVFEDLVDNILEMEEKQLIVSNVTKRINSGGASSGIINKVQNNGTTYSLYNTMMQLLNGIEESNKLLNDMKEEINKL